MLSHDPRIILCTISRTAETKGIHVQPMKVVYNLEAPGISVPSGNLDNGHDF